MLGDVIVAADGKPVRTLNDLFRVLDDHDVGDTIELTVLRDDREVEVKITLQAIP